MDGTITAVGTAASVKIPAGATRVKVSGKTIMPGMINAHGHVGDVRGLKASQEFYTPEHVKHQLAVFARYGVTTVFSLGGDGPAGVQVRDEKPAGIARLFVAGPVIAGVRSGGRAGRGRRRQGDEGRHREDPRRRQPGRGKEDARRGLPCGHRSGAHAGPEGRGAHLLPAGREGRARRRRRLHRPQRARSLRRSRVHRAAEGERRLRLSDAHA